MLESPLRVAYLVSEYPKLSHAFIASEINGMRDAGIDVQTFSIRKPSETELRSVADRAEARRTTYLIGRVRSTLPALIAFAALHPSMVAHGSWQAFRFCSGKAGWRRLFYLLEALVLVQELSQRNIRHVHVHLANNAADVAHLTTRMGRLLDRRRWTWSLAVHGPHELSDVTAYNLRRKVRSASLIACITEYCRSQILMLMPISRWDDVHIVRMGVAFGRFPEARRELESHGRPTRLLFVGRLVVEKAPQLLIAALARCSRGEFELRIVGAGELRAELEHEIARHQLSAEVELVGSVGQDELPEHYAWADVFCLPSFAEGLPVVIMEAMATGLPVVSTPIAGIPELVRNGDSGLLVTPGNVDALTDAICALRDPDVRAAMGARAARLVRNGHNAAANARGLADLLRAAGLI